MLKPIAASEPPSLKAGDKVAITCPAKKLPVPMTDAEALLTAWGLEVVLGDTVNASWNQFAGDDAMRAADLQRFIDDDSIKAIIAARGGYGTVRIIDKVDFTKLIINPKWLVGFSDITILHTHVLTNCNLQSIHGQMPVNIPDAALPSLNSLRSALFGDQIEYRIPYNQFNRPGDGTGVLAGGNLSLLIAVSGSISDLDYTGKILFIEDVGEYLYAIDRMMYCLKRAGKLAGLAGLVAGSFTDVKDNDIPFGQTVPEIIRAVVEEYDYPVCFDFPAGHISNNQSLVFGRAAYLSVNAETVTLNYI